MCVPLWLLQLGETPLHASSQSGHSEVAEALIDSGAQLDIPTRVSQRSTHDVMCIIIIMIIIAMFDSCKLCF